MAGVVDTRSSATAREVRRDVRTAVGRGARGDVGVAGFVLWVARDDLACAVHAGVASEAELAVATPDRAMMDGARGSRGEFAWR